MLLRQRIWFVPSMFSAASICHSLKSSPAGRLVISWRAPPTSTKALPPPRLSSLLLPRASIIESSLRIVPTTAAGVPMV